MNLSLSTKTFDVNGLLQLEHDQDSETNNLKRRVSRTATLDGGATFDDMGFSWADAELKLKFKALTEAEATGLNYLCENYGELLAVNKDGVFNVLVNSLNIKAGAGDLSLLILEKVA